MELTGDQLRAAETEVKRYLPRSAQVYGFLVLRNRVSSDPYSVYVDRWPQFRVIFCKPHHKQESDIFKDILIFANDEAVLREILRNSTIVDWSIYLCLGTSYPNMEVVRAVALEKNVPNHKLAECHLMMMEDVSRLPCTDCSGLIVSSLDESHISLVRQTWKFGQNHAAAGMIRNMISNFPSCCVLDAEGKPASWVLTYASCSMGMLHTLPEHRGKGYAKVVIANMSRKLAAQGYPVFCFIEEENVISYQLFKSMGFTEAPSHREAWFAFNDL